MGKTTATGRLEDSSEKNIAVPKKELSAKKKGSSAKKKAAAAGATKSGGSQAKGAGSKAASKATKAKGASKKKAKPMPSLEFLEQTHPAVRSQLSKATDLPEFLDTVGNLTLEERKQIVEQSLVLMQENFVHLPLKEAMHGIDPIQRLKLVQHRLEQSTPQTMGSEFQFHRDMIDVFTSIRDLHTNYLLPMPFADKAAFMPFDVEECFDNNGKPLYIASHFVPGFTHEHFKQGVTITTWNGVPIRRAIEISADQHAGSNLSARHAQGIDGLTVRPLRRSLPPDAMWVIIGYTDLEGVERELKQAWIVTSLSRNTGSVDANTASEHAACLGLDLQADLIQQVRKMLFAPTVVAEEQDTEKTDCTSKADDESEDPLETRLTGIFRAKRVNTPNGEFGYIRIFSFNINDPDAFVEEFVRLVELLPQQGLIVDVRANGGGHIYASEGLLQVLTPGEITPEPTQFINTPLNGRICERHRRNPVGIDLSPWVDSIRNSVETGAVYSRGYPITPYEFANNRGQKYHGPVVLITDARCYSATDIFAAGFQDHNIGHILGVDGNTGAGGANVWEHGLLRELLRVPQPEDPETPYFTLPHGAGMRVAIRRTLRVGDRAGTPVEDLGVVPDSQHALTKNDLLNGNEDLINAAGKILSGMPVKALVLSTKKAKSKLTIKAETVGLDRIDVYIDERPVTSSDIEADGDCKLNVALPAGAAMLKVMGYEENQLVAARRVAL